jgi:hypothetical protein
MIEIKLLKIEGDMLKFNVSIDKNVESDNVTLDEVSCRWISSVMAEKPFKSKPINDYVYTIAAVEEGGGIPEKYLTIEISNGKSRLKRKSEIGKGVFLKFWTYLHHQKLPSEIKPYERSS